MDHLLVVSGGRSTTAAETNLHEQKLMERRHLQEWLIDNPQVLGEDVLVVTSEFGSWEDADGAPARDRLDILALDSSGRLVVVELKRGLATRDVHLQAITYAALVSRFTLDTLAAAHRDFSRGRNVELSLDDARSVILGHVGADPSTGLDTELLRRPRLVLIASGFPKQVTHTVVWLSEMNLDIDLVQVAMWQVGKQLVAGFSRIYPIPEVAAFTLAPAREETVSVNARVQQRTRNKDAVRALIDAELLPDGTRFRLQPGHRATTPVIVDAISAWADEDDRRRWASWANDPSAPLVWDADGKPDTPSSLATRILDTAAQIVPPSVRGTTWWVLDDQKPPSGVDPADWARLQGHTLVGLVEELRPTTRDWSGLHQILDAIPPGRWTTYGDLATVIGSHAVPVGSHIARCRTCKHPWRVLNASGRVSTGFTWGDPDRRDDPVELLQAEGLAMTGGAADRTSRLPLDDLRGLLEVTGPPNWS